MNILNTMPNFIRSSAWIVAFAVLFLCYQAPEWLGIEVFQSLYVSSGIMLGFLPIAWLVAHALGRTMRSTYALEVSWRAALLLSGGFFLAVLVKFLFVKAGYHAGIYVDSTAPALPKIYPGMISFTLLATLVPSLAEDILTRGFWARQPFWKWTGKIFVVSTALLYVANHIHRLGNGPAEWGMLFCFGLAYGTAFWRTGSLWAAVGLHWGWNFCGQWLDLIWPTEAVNANQGKMLSALAHLLFLALALLLFRHPRGVRTNTSCPIH